MAEEVTNPIQAVPGEAAPEQAVPAAPAATAVPAASADPNTPPRKGSPLLVFLTVLLILVGIIDVILWGVAGYYFLRSAGNGTGGEQAQVTSIAGAPADAREAALDDFIRI